MKYAFYFFAMLVVSNCVVFGSDDSDSQQQEYIQNRERWFEYCVREIQQGKQFTEVEKQLHTIIKNTIDQAMSDVGVLKLSAPISSELFTMQNIVQAQAYYDVTSDHPARRAVMMNYEYFCHERIFGARAVYKNLRKCKSKVG